MIKKVIKNTNVITYTKFLTEGALLKAATNMLMPLSIIGFGGMGLSRLLGTMDNLSTSQLDPNYHTENPDQYQGFKMAKPFLTTSIDSETVTKKLHDQAMDPKSVYHKEFGLGDNQEENERKLEAMKKDENSAFSKARTRIMNTANDGKTWNYNPSMKYAIPALGVGLAASLARQGISMATTTRNIARQYRQDKMMDQQRKQQEQQQRTYQQ